MNNINFNNPEDHSNNQEYVGVSLDLSLGLSLPLAPFAPPLSQPQTMPQVPVYSERFHPSSLYYQNHAIQFPYGYPDPHSVRPPTTLMNSNEPPLPHCLPRPRRNAPRNDGDQNHERIIEPPYPWATNRPAVVHELPHIKSNLRIETITGMVWCSRCNKAYQIAFNLVQKMEQFWDFLQSKKDEMHNRAPDEWTLPPSLRCDYCDGDGVKPIIDENKDNINWLFLFLGQMLGYCTLQQLKYFCACTNNHRTGAKDRVLYLTYREIFRQLLPNRTKQNPW